MAILVTGATGTIGTQVLAHLAGEGAEVRALSRGDGKGRLPADVRRVAGEVGDVDATRAALAGVSTLFVLVPNVADELTRAMLTIDLAIEAGVRGIVYLSVYRGADFADVPHYAGKATVERMLADTGAAATVLRPNYFMQNDVRQREPLTGAGAYAMPVGARGISMVDTRDIGLAAARELLRRERADAPLPPATFALVGPDALTGAALAAIWAEALGRDVAYGGDDLDALEGGLRAGGAPDWLARDMRLMMRRYQADGAVASAADLAETEAVLGRPPRRYRDFAGETASRWRDG